MKKLLIIACIFLLSACSSPVEKIIGSTQEELDNMPIPSEKELSINEGKFKTEYIGKDDKG